MLLAIDPNHPEPRKIRRAVSVLEEGGVIAYPTDTVYGIGCDLINKRAIDRIYEIKRMDHSHPLAFVCPDLAHIARYAIVDNQVYRVLRRFLPGPYTFILEATREVPKLVQMKRKTVGIRVPSCEATRALVRELGRPIISSTAAAGRGPAGRSARNRHGIPRALVDPGCGRRWARAYDSHRSHEVAARDRSKGRRLDRRVLMHRFASRPRCKGIEGTHTDVVIPAPCP